MQQREQKVTPMKLMVPLIDGCIFNDAPARIQEIFYSIKNMVKAKWLFIKSHGKYTKPQIPDSASKDTRVLYK